MIIITQLIYVKEGKEKIFDKFENIAIPLLARYKGRMLLRTRVTDDTVVERQIDKPYEIHLIEFDSERDIVDFMQDKERQKFLHLKEDSIQSSVLIKGNRL